MKLAVIQFIWQSDVYGWRTWSVPGTYALMLGHLEVRFRWPPGEKFFIRIGSASEKEP